MVTGGARSGKSAFAERYAAKYGEKIAYIATAQIYDEEMRLRVALHRKRRPKNWDTYEAPYQAEQAITVAAIEHDTILFDCLTIYISNLLCSEQLPKDAEDRLDVLKERVETLISHARAAGRRIVFVTNEVGMGIVPQNALAREYRDFSGLANQMIAASADHVYLVISGLAVDVKKIATVLEE